MLIYIQIRMLHEYMYNSERYVNIYTNQNITLIYIQFRMLRTNMYTNQNITLIYIQIRLLR